jgi:peroxiredoxin
VKRSLNGRPRDRDEHRRKRRSKSKVPTFELPDEEGRPFDLLEQLEEGPLVLIFYREDK